MMMSSFEYFALFGNRDSSTVTNEEIEEKRKSYNAEREKTKPCSEFKAWTEPGIITDEWGNQSVGVVVKTGFENEGS